MKISIFNETTSRRETSYFLGQEKRQVQQTLFGIHMTSDK